MLIAKAADVCLKPWSHAVVLIDPAAQEQIDDLHVPVSYTHLTLPTKA